MIEANNMVGKSSKRSTETPLGKRQAPGRPLDPVEVMKGDGPLIQSMIKRVDLQSVRPFILWYIQQRIGVACTVERIAPNVGSAPAVRADAYVDNPGTLTLLEIGPKDRPCHAWLRHDECGLTTIIYPGGATTRQVGVMNAFISRIEGRGFKTARYTPNIRPHGAEGSILSATLALLAQDAGISAEYLQNRVETHGLTITHLTLQHHLQHDIAMHAPTRHSAARHTEKSAPKELSQPAPAASKDANIPDAVAPTARAAGSTLFNF
jgi:hypothetical protein